MKLFYIIICIAVAICNMTVPYFMPARNRLINTSQKLSEVLETCSSAIRISGGELIVPRSEQKGFHWKNDEDYGVGFLMEDTDISANNYLHFKAKEVVFSFDGNSLALPYKENEDITLKEFAGVVYSAADNLSQINFLSSLLWGFLHVMAIMFLYMIIAYVLLRSVKYSVLARYTGVSLAGSSFIPAVAALVFTDNIMFTAGLFSFTAALVLLLLAFPDYKTAKAQEVLGEVDQQTEFPWNQKFLKKPEK